MTSYSYGTITKSGHPLIYSSITKISRRCLFSFDNGFNKLLLIQKIFNLDHMVFSQVGSEHASHTDGQYIHSVISETQVPKTIFVWIQMPILDQLFLPVFPLGTLCALMNFQDNALSKSKLFLNCNFCNFYIQLQKSLTYFSCGFCHKYTSKYVERALYL